MNKFYIKSLLILCFISISESQTCGTPTFSINQNRIINGILANRNSFPWSVSLRLNVLNLYVSRHICSGTLISDQHVLTAAHCVISYKPSQLAVMVGINNISTASNTSNTFYVSNMIYHSSYNASLVQNGSDIAILKLSKKVTLSATVGTICLPASTSSLTVVNQLLIVAGWGSTVASSTSSLATDIIQTKLKIINGNSICTLYLSPFYNSKTLYCVIDSTKYSNVCHGDSGDPLIYLQNGKWYLYGVASFVLKTSTNVCLNTYPSYFTQVPAYVNWINNATATL